VRAALVQTFDFRKAHALPSAVPSPNAAWLTPDAAIARDDQLRWPPLDAVTLAAQRFLDPVLAAELDATWSPSEWTWRE
jgi:hypothetical protein